MKSEIRWDRNGFWWVILWCILITVILHESLWIVCLIVSSLHKYIQFYMIYDNYFHNNVHVENVKRVSFIGSTTIWHWARDISHFLSIIMTQSLVWQRSRWTATWSGRLWRSSCWTRPRRRSRRTWTCRRRWRSGARTRRSSPPTPATRPRRTRTTRRCPQRSPWCSRSYASCSCCVRTTTRTCR